MLPLITDANWPAKIEDMRAGFAGRLVVMGDPDIRLGDGRLEWVDGGLVRDSEALAAEIDKQITEYLAALGGPNTIEEGDE